MTEVEELYTTDKPFVHVQYQVVSEWSRAADMAAKDFQVVHPVQYRVVEWERFLVILVTIDRAELALRCLGYDVIVTAVFAKCL